MSVIILEGPDGTFKTTIAKALADHLHYRYVHGSSFESALLSNEDLFDWYKTLLSTGDDMILDRSMYSNRVYAQVHEGYTLLSLDQVKELENILKREHQEIWVVLCLGEPEDLIKRVDGRGDDHLEVLDKMEHLVSKYKEVYEDEIDLPKGIYNSSAGDSQSFITGFIGYLIHNNLENKLKRNLCDTCVFEFPSCNSVREGSDFDFGTGEGNDNVYRCNFYINEGGSNNGNFTTTELC